MDIYDRLATRRASVAVVGLGYVGLPAALEFAGHFDVIGYDVDADRIHTLAEADFPPPSDGTAPSLTFTDDPQALAGASFYIITVATPVDGARKPDLGQLLSATATVGAALKPGDYVVYESTVFPGCTESECVPLLQRVSGLKCGEEFKVGYSPERINPTDAEHLFGNTPKIVSACDDEALEQIARVYSRVVKAALHKTPHIKAAEAAKLVENIQRNVNIALMNELSEAFDRMGIDRSEVISLASSKWNFVPYTPGLVGGHCIPVDPYYLISEAVRAGLDLPLTRLSCSINERMADYVARSVVGRMPAFGASGRRPRILVLGIAYKKNSDDIRNSGVAAVVGRLSAQGAECDTTDPFADAAAVKSMYGIDLVGELRPPYDGIVVAVPHDCYCGWDEAYFRELSTGPEALVADLSGVYNGRIKTLRYWTL